MGRLPAPPPFPPGSHYAGSMAYRPRGNVPGGERREGYRMAATATLTDAGDYILIGKTGSAQAPRLKLEKVFTCPHAGRQRGGEDRTEQGRAQAAVPGRADPRRATDKGVAAVRDGSRIPRTPGSSAISRRAGTTSTPAAAGSISRWWS